MADYVAGKLDWMAAGLATEGTNAERPRAGDVARRDVPTCGLDEPMAQVARRVTAAGWEACVVVNDDRVVLGLLRKKELGRTEEGLTAEEAMRPGPSTYRPYVDIQEMAEVMIEHDLPNAPITTSEGRLVGLLLKEDAARVALELHEREHHAHEHEGSGGRRR